MFSPSQNTEFYRFGHKLAISPSNVQGRPLGMLSKLNPETFFNQRLKARFGANTNLVMMNFFLPVLLQWTQIQNELNAETEKYGHINAPYHDEFRLLFGRSVPTVAAMVTHTLIEAGLDLAMIKEDFTFLDFASASSRTPEENLAFRQSVVRQSDYALKLKSHYYANVVEKLHLPRRWTYAFVGPEASKEEVEVFSSPVSAGCAFEDHIKRYLLVNLADTLTFACGQIAMFIPQVRYMLATREVVCSNNNTTGNLHRLRHGSSNNRRVTRQAPPSYVWKLPPTPTVSSSLIAIRDRFFNNTKNLFLSAVGAAIGSFLAGGNGGACEYWCSRLFPYIVTSASGLGTLKQRIDEVKKQIEDKTREIEEQQQRQQERQQQQEPRQNSTNTNTNQQHTSQLSEEELLQQEKEEEEERRRYFNETQALFAQRRAQQDDHVMNNNNNNADNNNDDEDQEQEQNINLQNSPVHQHRPLQHPEQRQIVLEDE